ncbi:MAG: hypothetical protein ABJU26_15135, partial [Flavobacteriaceae bacterium]
MNKEEIKNLADYLEKLSDCIPNGLWSLKDAVSFTCIELRMYARFGKKGKDFEKALEFAKSIPIVDDFNSDKIITWQLN